MTNWPGAILIAVAVLLHGMLGAGQRSLNLCPGHEAAHCPAPACHASSTGHDHGHGHGRDHDHDRCEHHGHDHHPDHRSDGQSDGQHDGQSGHHDPREPGEHSRHHHGCCGDHELQLADADAAPALEPRAFAPPPILCTGVLPTPTVLAQRPDDGWHPPPKPWASTAPHAGDPRAAQRAGVIAAARLLI